MPLISESSYNPPIGFRGHTLQTVFPTVFRRVPLITLERERLLTPDNDFLDLDWSANRSFKKLAIITHGLEGSSRGTYCQGMARQLQKNGWDVLAWNFRGCSGEPNHTLKSYHCGFTEDLETVIKHAESFRKYQKIVLLGFSLGGNVTFKWASDQSKSPEARIAAVVGISVGIDLKSTALRLEEANNRIYMKRFLKTLRIKVREKIQRFPGQIIDKGLNNFRTFREFDDAYTAPIHGFRDVEDYWEQCSSARSLHKIKIPTLLVNTQDDPFLGPASYPEGLAKQSPLFYLETPRYGGHIGFVQFNRTKTYWSEKRSIDFINKITDLNNEKSLLTK